MAALEDSDASISSEESLNMMYENDEAVDLQNHAGTSTNTSTDMIHQLQVVLPRPTAGQGYVGVLFSKVRSIGDEEHIKCTERGQHVISLTTFLQGFENHTKSVDFAVNICTHLLTILRDSNSMHTIPSAVTGQIWHDFHKLRFNPTLHATWSSYLKAVETPSSLMTESSLLFQLLVDRLFKHFIAARADDHLDCAQTQQSTGHKSLPMTIREQNAIRYMAGYVATTLKKQFFKRSKNPGLREKREIFVQILSAMEASDQPSGVQTILEYTTLWTQMLDRGGLYHVKDEVFYLFQSIELVTRRHLHLDKVTELPIQQVAIEDCLKDQSILVKWEGIAKLPAKHEAYSIKLLRAIVTLWTKVRCFAFVKGWNEHFQTKAKFQKHGTRRSLKRKATE